MTRFWGPDYPDAANALAPAIPVIAFLSPTPDVPPGSPGGMPLSYFDASRTAISLLVSDTDGIAALRSLLVSVVFQDGTSELAYRRGTFFQNYVAKSSQASTSTSTTLSIARAQGWPGAQSSSNLAVGLVVDVVDSAGNIWSSSAYYQMPIAGNGLLVPPTAQVVAPTAADFSAEIRSLVVWQFRSA